MKARLLGGIAAVILAIVGTVLLLVYVQGADARAMAGTQTQQVLVVQKAIPAGTAASSFGDSVAVKSVPTSAVVNGAVKDLGTAKGKVAEVELLPGEQVPAARLVDPASLKGGTPVTVPDGMQQLSFTVPADRVVGGTLQPGDLVGLYFSYNQGVELGTQDNPATGLSIRKVLIINMQSVASGSDKQATPSNGGTATVGPSSWVVTVALSPTDTEKTVHAAEFGHIYLAKEPTGDQGATPGTLTKDKVLK